MHSFQIDHISSTALARAAEPAEKPAEKVEEVATVDVRVLPSHYNLNGCRFRETSDAALD